LEWVFALEQQHAADGEGKRCQRGRALQLGGTQEVGWRSRRDAVRRQLSLVFVARVLPPPEASSQSRLHTVYMTPRAAIRHRVPHAAGLMF